MYLPESQLFQLILALFLGTLVLLFAYQASLRIITPILIFLIPFPLISSRFGTINVYLIMLAGGLLLLRGKIRYIPMWGSVLLVLFACLLSLSQVHSSTYIEHVPYFISLASSFLLFYIVYNYVRAIPDIKYIIRMLLVLNVLVIFYNFLQVLVGYEHKTTFFGFVDISINHVRWGEQPRLTGPFGAGLTAEFLVICSLIIAHELLHTGQRVVRSFLVVLLGINLACLVATGNRGGLLTLLMAIPVFLYVFRVEMGWKKIVGAIICGSILMTLMSLIVINYTQFNSLYNRLEATEINNGIPDSRSETWPVAIQKIQEKPIFGHGPQLRLFNDWKRNIPDHDPIDYPHNLYLFLLYTVGIVGLIAFMVFLFGACMRTVKASRHELDDSYMHGLLKLGGLIFLVFFVDQIKVEFLRISIVDYWHFIFSIFATFVALADRAKEDSLARFENIGHGVKHSKRRSVMGGVDEAI